MQLIPWIKCGVTRIINSFSVSLNDLELKCGTDKRQIAQQRDLVDIPGDIAFNQSANRKCLPVFEFHCCMDLLFGESGNLVPMIIVP